VCAREAIGASSMFKVDTQGGGLCEDVTDLRFDLGVKSSAAEAELVLVVLRMLNSSSCTKAR
jgi:hypothetical protein